MAKMGQWLAGWQLLNPEGDRGMDARVEAVVERVDGIEKRVEALEETDQHRQQASDRS